MFYDKEIEIIEKVDSYLNEAGRWVEGGDSPPRVIECDVQPIEQKYLFNDYMIKENIQYRIFADVDDIIKVNNKVNYNNKEFTIKKIINWDSYVEFFIGN